MTTRVPYWQVMRAHSCLSEAAESPIADISSDAICGLLNEPIKVLRAKGWSAPKIIRLLKDNGLDLTLEELEKFETKMPIDTDKAMNVAADSVAQGPIERTANRLASLATNLPQLLTGSDENPDAYRTRFTMIADNLPDMIWMVNSNIQVTYLNARWNEYTGTVAGAGLDYEWHNFIHPADLPAVLEKWERCLRGDPFFEQEMRIRAADQSYRWFLCRGTPLVDEQGKVLSWFGTCSDIQYKRTAHEQLEKLVEERTAQLREALIDAERGNAVKSQFVATVSHEVRTPLSAIIGLAELLQLDELNAEKLEIVEQILLASTRLLKILNDILDFSKLEAGKVIMSSVRFQPRVLCEEIVAMFAPECAKKLIEFKLSIDSTLPEELFADETKIRQVLINFVSNAIKFTPTGKITIDVKPHASASNKLHISVIDTGVGIKREAQSCIFQPFMQADGTITRKFGGTGLGLSICKRYVEMMNGQIGFETLLGEGSTFWFNVPFVQGASERGQTAH